MKVYAIVEDGLIMSALFSSYEMASEYAKQLEKDAQDYFYDDAVYGVEELTVVTDWKVGE